MLSFVERTFLAVAANYWLLAFQCSICVILLTSSSNAQYLAWPPAERDQGITNCAPEECVLYFSIAPTGKYDPSANPTEAWIAQPEIQSSLKKLVAATEKLAKKNLGDSAAGRLLFQQSPAAYLKQPMAFFLSTVSTDQDPNQNSGALIVKLDDLEARTSALLKLLVAENQRDYETRKIEGATCYIFKPNEDSDPTISAGVINNYLILTVGKMTIDNVVDNLKTPPPTWLTELDQRISIQRPAMTAYVNFKPLLSLIDLIKGEDRKQFEEIDAIYGLTGFKTLQYQNGMNADGFNQVGHLDHSKPKEGLLSALATEKFELSDLVEIPENVSFAGAIKLDPEKILQLVKQTTQPGSGSGVNIYEEFKQTVKDNVGADFEKDLVTAIEGTMWGYSDPSLTSPKAVGAVKIKNIEKFKRFYSASMQSMKEQLASSPNGPLQEDTKGENTFYSAVQPGGQTFTFGLVEDHLYFSNSVRGITSHLRKKDRDSGKFVNTELMKRFFVEAETKGYEGVVGFSSFDLAGIFEVGLPLARIMFGQYSNRDVFDFSFEDVPEVGVLVNGLRPNTTAYFRTDKGIAFHSVHDFPVGIEATTGIMIGMLLPAVQQVRAAARRTQALNNLRQLALGILNYESAHGHFPPAYSVDDEGTPLLSWRVHVLPFMEENELYQQFHLDEPWDSAHNSALADQMPKFLTHPGFSLSANQTVYLGLVGEDSVLSNGPISDAGDGTRFESIIDGSSNTQLLIAADQKSAVVWTAPEDLRYGDLNDDDLIDAVSGYMELMSTVLCDGSTHTVSDKEINVMGGAQLRGGFNKSDGISLEFAP